MPARRGAAIVGAVLLAVGFVRDDRAAAGAGQGQTRDPAVSQQVVVDRYLDDIASFWARELPSAFGVDLDPVDRVVPYRPSAPETLPACDGFVYDSGFYAGNAFYCRLEHAIVYDAEGLVAPLRAAYGEFAVGLLLAHEYAHAIQPLIGETGPVRRAELQADCFAGAWAAGLTVTDARSVDGRILDRALGSYADAADPPGTPADDPAAHGSAAERRAAFATGFAAGSRGCVDSGPGPPFVTATRVPGGPSPPSPKFHSAPG